MGELPVMRVPVREKSPYYSVVIDRDLSLCGQTRLRQGEEPGTIVLRQWDEEVFLHECLHALLHEGQLTAIPGYGDDRRVRVNAVEEDLVAHLSHGLHEMGWRLMWPEQSDGDVD